MMVRIHQSGEWHTLAIILAVQLCVLLLSVLIERQRRRAKWAQVLEGAHRWAESVGGTLLRVSEQPAVYGTSFRGRSPLSARRYRVTFTDRTQTECVATLRCAVATDAWEVEKLTLEKNEQISPEVAAAQAAAVSAESYERRHRGKISNVSVIFASPRGMRPPRRST
jgi:hypothetical protein